MDAYARDFYNEIRALSMDTGGSIENILDNIGASCESLSSLIPQEKRTVSFISFTRSVNQFLSQELANFEMNLKQMIEEAKMLAESPGASREDLGREVERTPVRQLERSRSRKSDSVVSVIEAAVLQQTEDREDREPLPMSRRGVPTKRSPLVQRMEDPVPVKRSPLVQRMEDPVPVKRSPLVQRVEDPPPPPPPDYQEEIVPPPPLEEMWLPPPPSVPSRGSQKTTPQPPGSRRAANREPSVGSDRYEEIIVETRKRSQSRSRMGSRTSSVVDFKTSNVSLGKIDVESIRANAKNISALDLDTKTPPAQPAVVPEPAKKSSLSSRKIPVPAEASKKPVEPSGGVVRAPAAAKPQIVALDANGNTTAPSLPRVPQSQVQAPVTPDPLVKLFPKNIPDWFMITYTYSVVLILILLIANVTPDGKLYIHFTAFWSLIIYFVLEDDQVNIRNSRQQDLSINKCSRLP